jgi:glyoxylase-like metal-dependent hydrolase (beta-lactamase superfamily II)
VTREDRRTALDYPWSDAPEPGTTRVIAPGARWVRMRVPFPPDHINLFMIEDGAGWAIVDAGLGLDDTKAAWEAIFARELDGRRVTRVIVTHFHPDHIGLADWLARRWDVEVWMTREEWVTGRAVHAPMSDADLAAQLAHCRRGGVAEADLARHRRSPNEFYRKHVPSVPTGFRRLEGGVPLAIGAHHWHPLIGRGHAPEHACLWCPALGLLIAGDILLPRITPNVSVWPSEPLADPLRDFLEALHGFAHLPADTLVLPAHGQPYRGVHARIAELRRHHEFQLALIERAAREAPRSAVDLFALLFRREIGPHNLALALGEALAHLHRLEAERRVVREIGTDGVHRFAAG